MLDRIDLERYSRQLPILGARGQVELVKKHVAVVGLGGLGSLAAIYLVAAGIGRLTIVDMDRVEVNNLNRQILFTERDVGEPKALVAAKRLSELNPLVEVEAFQGRLTRDNAEEVLAGADVVVDGLDDWRTRLVIDEYAWSTGIHYVHAAVDGLQGQVMVVKRGETPCLACIAPRPLPPPGCVSALGAAIGMVASIETLEAIKIASGIGRPAYSRLIIVNAAEPSVEEVTLSKSMDCRECRERVSTEENTPARARGLHEGTRPAGINA